MAIRALSRSVRVRAGALAITGPAGFAIYAMSCVHSPVSWSPDSSKIALTVMPTDDEAEVMGVFVYDIESGKHQVIETMREDGILSALAWSPDGKWLAYYRIQPVKGEGEPDGAATATDTTKDETLVSELFQEDNRVQPGFVFEACRELFEEEDTDSFEIELVVVSADGKERKLERPLRWVMDDDERTQIAVLRPRWSADSKRVFYMRAFDKMGYVGSLDVATGDMKAHTFTSSVYWDVSPDGAWIAAYVDDSLAISRTDGTECRYLRVWNDARQEEADERPPVWAPDSKRVCLPLGKRFMIVNIGSGAIHQYEDATAEEIAYQAFSADGAKVFYVAKFLPEDGQDGEKAAAVRVMSLSSGKVETVILLPEIDPDAENGLGSFSVSPSGRVFLVRGVITKDDEESSGLIFWDGKQRRVVETDSWLETLPAEVGL